MALRTAKPVKPKPPIRSAAPRQQQGLRKASPAPNSGRTGLLQGLSNLSAQSGGTPPGGQGQQDPAGNPWESDPILQQIIAFQNQNAAAADAHALAARQQALINYGYSPELESLFGGDQGLIDKAKGNSFSTLGQLSHSHELGQTNINESTNRGHLYYSSTRANQLGEEGRGYLGQQYAAGQALTGQLGGIDAEALAAHQAAQGSIIGGQQDAYQRWLDNQLKYGTGGAAPAPRTVVRAPAKPALKKLIVARAGPLRRP